MKRRLAAMIVCLAGFVPGLPAGPAAMAAEQPEGASHPRVASPRVASMSLCTDQLVLRLARPGQILSVHWVSQERADSLMAEEALRYPANYGGAEQIASMRPDVVFAGLHNSPYARQMLDRLGIKVVTLAPATSLADVRANIRKVARHLGVPDRGEAMIARLDARLDALRGRLRPYDLGALVYGAGGYSAGAPSLFHSLLQHLGLANLAPEAGRGEWVSMSIEAVLRADADVLILGEYRQDAPSQASARLMHPALRGAARTGHPVRVPTRLWNCGTPAVALAGELIVQAVEGQTLAQGSNKGAKE